MEVAAKKFEMEGGILEEINQQAKRGGDGLYSYPSSNMSRRIEEDGYFPYCTIQFESIPEYGNLTPNESQEFEPNSHYADLLYSETINLNSEVSETSTSCVVSTFYSSAERLESASVPNNVRFSSLVITLPCLFLYTLHLIFFCFRSKMDDEYV